MTRNHLIRFTQVLVLAAIGMALALPATALGGSNAGTTNARDVFERYAATHRYGNGLGATRPARDVFERYAAVHSYGKGGLATTPAPDAFERYVALHTYGRGVLATTTAADVFERYVAAHLGGESLSLDAAAVRQPVQAAQPSGFDWTDAGIGAAMGAAVFALLATSILVPLAHRRNRAQAT